MMKTNAIMIFSDSAYIINCFKQNWYQKWLSNGWINSKRKPVENKDLWQQILSYHFHLGDHVNYFKVAGHSGIPENMEADRLAVYGKNSTETFEVRVYE